MLLDAKKTEQIIKKYKIQTPKQQLCKSSSEALMFAKKTGFPLVIKADAAQLVHKTEGGFVKVGINSPESLERFFNEITVKAKRAKMRLNGILVQQQVSGIECIVGMKEDPTFGKVVMFGLGGIYAEIMKDVVFRAAPLEREDAEEMVSELRNHEIFSARGRRSNLRAVVDVLVAVSKIAEGEKVREMDINPLFVSDKVFAADVKLLV
jgi:acetate---CoA ligase (ADP-forming)